MITRRTFVQAVGAGAAALPLRGAAKLNIGIGTYSYHNLSIEDMIVQLKALRIREIEMSRGEFMLLSHPKDEIFQATRAKLDKADIRCVSYYAATIKKDQEIDDAIRFAKLLGARNITGDATGELLEHIDTGCSAAGLTFGIHNHFFKDKFPFESPEDVLKALAGRSKTMGATVDTGQFASCGHDPADAVRKLAPYIKMVHLKDVAASGAEVNVLIGSGVAKIPQVIDELHKINYQGLVAIEYEKEGPVEEDMRREVEYARKLA
jgi:inosose dehydratase